MGFRESPKKNLVEIGFFSYVLISTLLFVYQAITDCFRMGFQ